MSISLPGKLRVKRLNGANGPFCVGDLETEIGDFRVKDAILDQFDEGLYEGQFCIQQIFPWSYTAYGRMVIEIRAKLADLQIDGHTRAGAERDSVEPDPAKESPVESVVPAPAPAAPPADPVTASPAVPIDAEQDTPKPRAPRTPAKPPRTQTTKPTRLCLVMTFSAQLPSVSRSSSIRPLTASSSVSNEIVSRRWTTRSTPVRRAGCSQRSFLNQRKPVSGLSHALVASESLPRGL